MGLSVLYEAVRRLQGEVEIGPRENGGTVLHLTVPLSIATHRLLLVQAGDQVFALPIHAIERLYRIGVKTIATGEGKPMVCLDSRQMPLYSLQHLLGLQRVAAGAPGILQVL